jgi:hypothetical protein
MTAFVLGNGVSRAGISISALQHQGAVYGCNALYRDHAPDVLVATDTAIAREIQQSGYARDHVFYTRRPLPDSGALTVPREYFGFSSGPIAVALAAQQSHDPIYLLGFDMGPDHRGRFNNCYAGTEFYKPQNSEPTFTGNWVRQLRRVLADHTTQSFVRVCGDTTARIPELESLHNLSHIGRDEFSNSINTIEDTHT